MDNIEEYINKRLLRRKEKFARITEQVTTMNKYYYDGCIDDKTIIIGRDVYFCDFDSCHATKIGEVDER